jgi:hypothetical protein
VISADPIDGLTSNALIRSEPFRKGNKGAARDNAGGHSLFGFERPNSTDPAGRRPYRTLSGLSDLGEEFAIPRKFWPDTFIKPLRILPDTKPEIDSAGEIRSGSLPGLRAKPLPRRDDGEAAATRQLI